MQYQKLALRVLLATLVILCTATDAAEMSWINGIAPPASWTIEPDRPADIDTIAFSGPLGLYANIYEAERNLGGRPVLDIDSDSRVVELRFEAPGRSDRTKAWDPVCGLTGTLGPLRAGPWLFLCSATGAEFSISFDVLNSSQIYYVDAAAAGANNGTSWADAFVHLQRALGVVTEGREIRVAQGTYRPNVGGNFNSWDPNAAFHMVSGVTVKGGFAGIMGDHPDQRDTIAYETILSGDLQGDDLPVDTLADLAEHYSRSDNCFHVVVTGRTDSTTILDGVTITGGRALSSVGDMSLRSGGGIYNIGGSLLIRDCIITGNAAQSYGGGIYSNSNPGPIIEDCVIFGNWCESWGGGVLNAGSGDITIERCLVSSNGALVRGGGIGSYNGVPAISNCIISGNTVTASNGMGGAYFGQQVTAEFDYCTIVGNTAPMGPALSLIGAVTDRSDVQVNNCIIWNGADAISTDAKSDLEIEYCDVQGGWPGDGNIAEDPCFIEVGFWDSAGTPSDPSDDTWYDGDYRLVSDSPCIGAGNPRQVVDDEATDLYGNPRRSGSAVDMGVHEVRNAAPIAQAESDPTGFTLDSTTGVVTLDGGDSYDPDGSALTYRWYRGSDLVSTEAQFSIELPLGAHAFTLIVNDGAGDSAPLRVTATIHQAVETEMSVWPKTIRRQGGLSKVVVSLRAPSRSANGVSQNYPVVLFPGGIEAKSQNVLTWFSGKVMVVATFDERELLKSVSGNGAIEIRAVGRLKNGQYFTAGKTVKVKR